MEIAVFLLFLVVDITVYRNGYHGDLNETFYIGEVDEGAKRLVQTTYECLMQAIDAGKSFLKPVTFMTYFLFTHFRQKISYIEFCLPSGVCINQHTALFQIAVILFHLVGMTGLFKMINFNSAINGLNKVL